MLELGAESAVKSVAEMHKLAADLAGKCVGGELIGLSGELGAGKTEFTKGFLKSLGFKELVTSPSYTVQNIYPLEGQKISEVHHFDCYRLGEGSGIEQFRENSLQDELISLVEWPEKLPELKDLLSYHLQIKFGASNTEQRLVVIEDMQNA